MAQVLGFESHGGRSSTGLQASPGGVGLLWFYLIGEVVPDSGNGEENKISALPLPQPSLFDH